MELNPQRKLFISVLAVALVALVVDRVIIGGSGPASAHAAGEAVPAVPAESPAAADKTARTEKVVVPSLAQRIRDVEKARRAPARPDEHTVQPGFSDAILADGAWLPRQAEAAPAPSGTTKAEAPTTELEAHGLAVSAVLNHLAVINGKPFKLNEQLEIEVAGGRKVMVTLLEVDGKARQVRVLADGRELVLVIASKDSP